MVCIISIALAFDTHSSVAEPCADIQNNKELDTFTSVKFVCHQRFFWYLAFFLVYSSICWTEAVFRCQCGQCNDEHLVGALEFRCCREIADASAKMAFDGSIERISCITQHEDFTALSNRTVLLQVGPLLRGKDGRTYRRRTGVPENE